MLPANHIAYIALGSNLDDRIARIDEAIDRLTRVARTPVLVSHLYDTLPMYLTEQPRFVNAVARLETDLEPEMLLDALLAMEASMGRLRGERNGPRVIDLDLLLWNDLLLESDRLTLPHPRLHERPFVLRPLNDIAAGLLHPSLGRTMAELWTTLEPTLAPDEQPVRLAR